MFARNRVHGAQHRFVADAPATQRELKLHPLYVVGVDIRHNSLVCDNESNSIMLLQLLIDKEPQRGKSE
jgi:hypothetical protein